MSVQHQLRMEDNGFHCFTLFSKRIAIFLNNFVWSPYSLLQCIIELCFWQSWPRVTDKRLRILAMYEAENSKICKLWTFWPVIQLINHLFKIRQKWSFISWITGQIVQKLEILPFFASCIASILKGCQKKIFRNVAITDSLWIPRNFLKCII